MSSSSTSSYGSRSSPPKGTALAMPPGPKTLSAQFPGSTAQYDYFIPVGPTPRVGDIILTSTLWGAVPGAGRMADRIMGKAVAVDTTRPRKPSKGSFLDDGEDEEEDTSFGAGMTITMVSDPISTGPQDTAFSIAAALAFLEKLKPAIVTRIHDGITSPKANRFYVMSVAMADLVHQKTNLDGVIMRTVEQMKARARLAEIVREQAEMDLYRKVAETNPEAQRLIQILQGSLTHPNDPIKD